jgi:iron(III) transport system permease protein
VLVAVGVPALVPVLFVMVNSVMDSLPGQAANFTFAPWERAFTSARTLSSIYYSLLLALRVPVGIAIAFGIAWLLVRVDLPGRTFITYSLWFNFFLPALPMTLGWVLLAHEDYGLLNELFLWLPFVDEAPLNIMSVSGILWVHLTLSTVPIMTILLLPALQNMDSALEEASDVAGAPMLSTMRRITLPLIVPAILTAFVAGLIKSLEVFEVEQLLGIPAGIFVYSTRIYNLLRVTPPDYPQAMALSMLFLILLFAVGMVYQRVIRRFSGNTTLGGKGVRVHRRKRTWWAYVASGLLFLGVLVSAGMPFLILILGSFTRLFGFFFIDDPWTVSHWGAVLTNQEFLTSMRNSLVIGFVVGTVGTLAYAGLAWSLARTRWWSRSMISVLVWLPWAIPGVLMGTAFLNLFLNVPLLTGLRTTLFPLILVLIVQSLPLGTHMLRSGVEQISGELEEASYVCGGSRAWTFVRIVLPLLMPMFVSVFMLVFMTALKDISATVLLATPGTRTLPLLMFNYASVGRMEPAVVIGVITALVALAITAVAFRVGKRLSIEI